MGRDGEQIAGVKTMFTVVFLVFGIIQNGGEFDNVADAQARYDEIVADDPAAIVYLFNDEAETTSAQIVATNDPKWLERLKS